MKTSILTALLVAAFGLASVSPVLAADASPAPSPAASASPSAQASPQVLRKYDLLTVLKSNNQNYSIGGEMLLRVMDDGTVRGSYTAEGRPTHSLTGTLKGKNLSFDVSSSAGFHVDGTLEADGSISGSTILGTRGFSFSAQPKT